MVVIEGAVGAAVSRFYTDVLAGHWPPERRLVEEGYRSLAFLFAPIVVPELALEADWDFDRFFGYLGTWSAVPALEQATGVEPLGRFRAELASAWGERSRRLRVRWPLALRAGHV